MQRCTPTIIALAATLVLGCGGGEDDSRGRDGGMTASDGASAGDAAAPPGDGAVEPAVEAVMPPLYRLRVLAGEEGPTIEEITYVGPRDGSHRPLVPLMGQHLLVARAGGAVVDVVPVLLPESYVGEAFGEDFAVSAGTETAAVGGSTVTYVDASVELESIELVAQDGTIIETVAAADLPPTTAVTRTPFPEAPWVELIGGRDFTRLPSGMVDGAILDVADGSAELAILGEALALLPPRLASAVTAVGIAPLDGLNGIAYGGLIILDDELFAGERPHIHAAVYLSHEAAHAFHNASKSLDGATYPEWRAAWDAGYVSQLEELHREFGFERDVGSFWQNVQRSAVTVGLSVPYQGDAYPMLTDYLMNGFVSDYASKNGAEDLAETVQQANLPSTTRMSPALSVGACAQYAAGDEIPKRAALVYVKYMLVHQLGLVSETDRDWCLEGAVPATSDGIHFEGNTFDRELSAGYTSEEATHFVIVGKDGSDRGLAVELTTRERRPTGFYALDDTWWHSWDGDNSAVLAADAAGDARTAARGLVVITYASSDDRVEGMMMDLAFQNAFGTVTSEWDYVPFRISF